MIRVRGGSNFRPLNFWEDVGGFRALRPRQEGVARETCQATTERTGEGCDTRGVCLRYDRPPWCGRLRSRVTWVPPQAPDPANGPVLGSDSGVRSQDSGPRPAHRSFTGMHACMLLPLPARPGGTQAGQSAHIRTADVHTRGPDQGSLSPVRRPEVAGHHGAVPPLAAGNTDARRNEERRSLESRAGVAAPDPGTLQCSPFDGQTYACVYVCVYICVCMQTYARVYVRVCMRMYACVYVYVYTCVTQTCSNTP